MRFYPVMGQCSAWISSKLKSIGFGNIESIERIDDGVIIKMKPQQLEGSELIETYKLKLEVIKTEVNPKKETND